MNGKKIRQYTLVELLVTTAIICILVALLVVGYNNVYAHWSTSNTIGAMKQIEVVFEDFRKQNGYIPETSSSVTAVQFDRNSTEYGALARELQQIVSLAREANANGQPDSSVITIFDDYGHDSPIYYIYPYKHNSTETGTFALFSKGKDGQWGGLDDVVFLPNGIPGTLNPGFYQGDIDSSGDFTPNQMEPLAK